MDYYKYIISKIWKNKSYKFMFSVGFKCEECGSSNNLTCHHRTYKNLGNETKKDIKVLCWECHKAHHKKYRYGKGTIKYGKKQLDYIERRKELNKNHIHSVSYKPIKKKRKNRKNQSNRK